MRTGAGQRDGPILMVPYGSTPTERLTMTRVLAALFAFGAAFVLVTLALPQAAGAEPLALGALCAVATAAAGALLVLGAASSIRLIKVVLALGSALITGCVVAGGQNGEAYVLLYVWVAVYSGFFLNPRTAVAEVGVALGLLGVGLALAEPFGGAATLWLMAAVSLLVGASLVSFLASAVRTQAADLASIPSTGAAASRGGDYAQEACDGLTSTLRADVAIYLSPLGDGGGLEVLAMAGAAEAGMVFTGDVARAALEGAFRSGEAAEIVTDESPVGLGRLNGRSLGLAQPVLREGAVVAVLAVAWSSPRRSLPSRTTSVAQLHAARVSLAVDRVRRVARDRERQALEINDNIVQGLVVAKYSAQLGDVPGAIAAVDDTLVRARKLISDQLSQVAGRGVGAIRPGDLARAQAAGVSASTAPQPPTPSPG